jgi:3-oxoacyl-[acyl-carrier-protein] synthase-3
VTASSSPSAIAGPSKPTLMSKRDPAVYLAAPAYALGQLHPIDDLPQLASTTLEGLRAAGLRQYARTDESLRALLGRSLARTLEATSSAREEVGLAVFATNSTWKIDELRTVARELLAESGLIRAFPLLVSLADCANLQAAIRFAANAVLAGQTSTVLVATVDLVPPGLDRLVPPAIGVLSDGAASCIVSRHPEGLKIQLMHQASDARLGAIDPGREQTRYFLENNRGLERTLKETLAAWAGPASGFSRVFFNNYNRPVAEMTTLTGGFRREAVFVENIARAGHVVAADNLVNLVDSLTARAREPGEVFFALATGQTCWATMILGGE